MLTFILPAVGIPYEDVAGEGGFFSGFYPLTAVTNNV